MAFVVTALWTAKLGNEDQVASAVSELVEPSRNEPGIILYQPHRDPGDPRRFFFYEQYVDRAAYEAHGGYAGTQMLASLTRRYPTYWIGAYVRHDFLDGASFIDSPLVNSRSYWSGGVAAAWIIRQSAHVLESED